MLFTGPQLAFSHFPSYPQATWALLVLIPRWMVLCTFQDPVGPSNELSCEAGSFSYHHNPHRFLPPEISRLSFPAVEPWVAQSVSLPSSSRFIYIQIWDLCILQPQPHLPHPPAIALLCVLSLPRMLISAPPTGLDECFFFNSLSDFHTIQFSGCSGGFLFLNLLSFF